MHARTHAHLLLFRGESPSPPPAGLGPGRERITKANSPRSSVWAFLSTHFSGDDLRQHC
jgi:hypothetical protein